MDQALFNWLVGLCGAIGGWVLKVIWEAIKDLKSDVKLVDCHLNENFVRRDDFKDAVREMKDDMKEGFNKVDQTLSLLFKKLEGKEDR